jgi:hypothetical protein
MSYQTDSNISLAGLSIPPANIAFKIQFRLFGKLFTVKATNCQPRDRWRTTRAGMPKWSRTPGAGGAVEPPVTRLIRTTATFFVKGFGFVKG